jgi:hypothetical protein
MDFPPVPSPRVKSPPSQVTRQRKKGGREGEGEEEEEMKGKLLRLLLVLLVLSLPDLGTASKKNGFTLDHEVGNDSVERRALVAEAEVRAVLPLAGSESSEVLDSSRNGAAFEGRSPSSGAV